MIRSLLAAMDAAPQRVLWSLFGVCLAMISFGLYLQFSQNLNPCPMCIVQRYALFFVAITAGLAGASGNKVVRLSLVVLLLIGAGFGAFVAARQSWLQWFPPQIAACGRDFYGMIEAFPLQRAIPMIFKGSGDCAKVDWTFLGGSIANWSFVCFVLIGLLALTLLWRQVRRA
jgi:disulfide bond formation protein DsbB